jgi:DNA-binding response OmpR family regulator
LVIDDHQFVHVALAKFLGIKIGLQSKPGLKALQARLMGGDVDGEDRPFFEVDSAYSGKEGVTRLGQARAAGQPYAVAFVDVRLRGAWDGLETVRQLWQQDSCLQVVLCTVGAQPSWEDLVDGLREVENLALVRKPFEREEVLQLTYMLARRWQAQVARATQAGSREKYRFLLLEDDPLTQRQLETELRNRLPEVTLLTARTVAEAQTQLMGGHIDFFLLDVLVPDGSGIDFLCELQGAQPNAMVVVMTAQALGEYRAAAAELGVLRFMEKPVNMDEIISLVREQQRSAARAVTVGNSEFAASLRQLTTLDIIQLKCLSRATTALEFVHADGERGLLCFRGGEIIHAETGDKTGEAALVHIAGWRRGRAEEIEEPIEREQTIDIPWQGLLLNTVQQLDERAA